MRGLSDIVGASTLRDRWEQRVSARGACTFLVFEDEAGTVSSFSYREFDDEVNRTANLLSSQGVRKGERVVTLMRTCPDLLICLIALAKIGAVTVPLSERSRPDELRYAVERAQAVLAVTTSALAGPLRDLAAEGLLSRGVLTCADLARARASASPALRQRVRLLPEDPVEVMFTSGTTARPKGVLVTHANMVFSGVYGAWQTALRPDDRLLTTMPACHSNFQLAALTPVIEAGATLVMVQRYSASRFWDQVRAHRATVAQCVAMMLRTLLLQPRSHLDRAHGLRELLYFQSVTDRQKGEFEERFGVSLMNTYGSTESICWVLTDPPLGPRRWPSVGRPGLGYEVRIADGDDREVPAGSVGEIQVRGVRGRTLMAGYLDDADATARAFAPDGWMRTGDQGYRDADGWFYFVERKANLIKRAGRSISAIEVEDVLSRHPAVDEAAVVGVDDPIRDQEVCAFVRLVPDARLTPDQVRAFCAEHLADYKVPTRVLVVDEFPRTPSMKVEKRRLAQMARTTRMG
ncbi:AMP-binding protein [Berryella wangjianweii]|uniref:AMP-binding protein n=1 Tax=Berryella wangjianweii TaxID=2734634 RepID=UPI0028F72340|nr:AMP-binding protein [Berryella wangjianweii]